MIAISTKKLAFGAMGCLLLAACGSGKSTTAAQRGAIGNGPGNGSGDGSGCAPGGGGGGLTACGLLTENEASKAIGAAAGKGSGGGSAALSECIYGDGALIVSMKTDSKALYDKQHADATAKGHRRTRRRRQRFRRRHRSKLHACLPEGDGARQRPLRRHRRKDSLRRGRQNRILEAVEMPYGSTR